MGSVVNLLPKGKVDTWTLSFEDENGEVKTICNIKDKEEVFMRLLEIKDDNNIDINSVVVYPPNSNITYDELQKM